ncbi:MAG: hypothetical protein B6242_06645 [Anaerolineaceae bacterium 4572_78]|nr:MAG: hypothetical protein B6242_06645 [Anaerolineaceae bacterium 4572_78]
MSQVPQFKRWQWLALIIYMSALNVVVFTLVALLWFEPTLPRPYMFPDYEHPALVQYAGTPMATKRATFTLTATPRRWPTNTLTPYIAQLPINSIAEESSLSAVMVLSTPIIPVANSDMYANVPLPIPVAEVHEDEVVEVIVDKVEVDTVETDVQVIAQVEQLPSSTPRKVVQTANLPNWLPSQLAHVTPTATYQTVDYSRIAQNPTTATVEGIGLASHQDSTLSEDSASRKITPMVIEQTVDISTLTPTPTLTPTQTSTSTPISNDDSSSELHTTPEPNVLAPSEKSHLIQNAISAQLPPQQFLRNED